MKKILGFIIIFLVLFSSRTFSKELDVAANVLKDVPYNEGSMGKRKLVDEKYLLVMQAALKPEQMVPQHDANSNVHLLILEGEVVVNLDGKDITAAKGDLLPVANKTPMNIKNKSASNATFLIIKAPHPSKNK